MSYHFVAKTRDGAIVDHLHTTDDALVAEAMQFIVDGVGEDSVRALAEARIETNPDYNQAPAKDDMWVMYRSKAGRPMICEVLRLSAPDDEGYPMRVELLNPQRREGSFNVFVSAVTPVDFNSLPKGLANAILQGHDNFVQDGGGNRPVLKHGMRRKE